MSRQTYKMCGEATFTSWNEWNYFIFINFMSLLFPINDKRICSNFRDLYSFILLFVTEYFFGTFKIMQKRKILEILVYSSFDCKATLYPSSRQNPFFKSKNFLHMIQSSYTLSLIYHSKECLFIELYYYWYCHSCFNWA